MAIPLKTKLFAALFGLTFAAFGWAILFYSDWFIPSTWVSWVAAAGSAALALWVIRNSPLAVLERRFLVKLGAFAMLCLWSWLFFAQTVPGVITRLGGSTHQVIAHVSQHYRSTRTCRNRLILREFNPPFGAFCRVTSSKEYIATGHPVLVTYDQSVFGRFVLRVESAR